MKKVAILQSNYIPWKGYFDLLSYVDKFTIYDDMHFTKRDWRNRNKIKKKVVYSGFPYISYLREISQKINETKID